MIRDNHDLRIGKDYDGSIKRLRYKSVRLTTSFLSRLLASIANEKGLENSIEQRGQRSQIFYEQGKSKRRNKVKKAIVLGADNGYLNKLETTIKSVCTHKLKI